MTTNTETTTKTKQVPDFYIFESAGCLNVFGMAAAVDGAYSGFLGKAGTETLPDLQVR